VSFDEHHFKEDLQFPDAVAMLGRLKQAADERGLTFGAKLTNTFPVDIKQGELPGEEMYMSGRALFPLTAAVVAKITDAFAGALPISYSGGVDRFNIERILATGIRPVTMATSILKPGGYERMHQIAELAEACIDPKQGAIDTAAAAALHGSMGSMTRHKKQYRQTGGRKGDTPLPLTDCAAAPCSVSGCPIHQQIPAYLEQIVKGDLARAFAIIANDNVLPSVTGTICDHQCQNRCTRIDYDDPLQIRRAKKASSVAAQAGYTARIEQTPLKTDKKILVIGAGPAGVAAAVYLRRNGVAVDVREMREHPFGIVSAVIPAFRISAEEIALDEKMAEAIGVNFTYGAPADYDLAALKNEYDYIILATGAWLEGKGHVRADGDHVLDALKFLETSKKSGLRVPLGGRVAVIGAGDVAMDCARAAARNEGHPETVIVYRRTRAFMPASPEEISAAEADGVKITECRSPVAFENGELICEKMTLGDFDQTGRRSVTPSGERERFAFDTVINAVGAGVDTSLFTKNGVDLDERGVVVVSEVNETSVPGVYIAGDCKAGPATVVKAMADAKKIAVDILTREGIAADFVTYQVEACRDELIGRKGVVTAKDASSDGADAASARCLACGDVCEICVDVCPNRANIAIDTGDAFAQRHQVIHVDRMCNECGNCGVFCPDNGDPYKGKFTVFSTAEDFEDSENSGFLKIAEDAYRVRLRDGSVKRFAPGEPGIPADYAVLIVKIGAEYASLF
jgi:putative selenate reductase